MSANETEQEQIARLEARVAELESEGDVPANHEVVEDTDYQEAIRQAMEIEDPKAFEAAIQEASTLPRGGEPAPKELSAEEQRDVSGRIAAATSAEEVMDILEEVRGPQEWVRSSKGPQ